MRHIPQILSLVAAMSSYLLAQAAKPTSTTAGESEQEIKRLEIHLTQARSSVPQGGPSLEDLLADDYVRIGLQGDLASKNDEIEKRNPKLTLARGTSWHKEEKHDDQRIRVYGETAVATSTVSEREWSDAQDEVRRRYRATNVYVKRGERWQIVLSQSTPLDPQ